MASLRGAASLGGDGNREGRGAVSGPTMCSWGWGGGCNSARLFCVRARRYLPQFLFPGSSLVLFLPHFLFVPPELAGTVSATFFASRELAGPTSLVWANKKGYFERVFSLVACLLPTPPQAAERITPLLARRAAIVFTYAEPARFSCARSLRQLIPKRQSSARGTGGGGGGVGGFLGGIGRHLQAVTETAGGLLNDCGIGAPPRPAGGKGEGDWTTEWMKTYAPALAHLTLSEMSLPGTHDSGTAKMVREDGRCWS